MGTEEDKEFPGKLIQLSFLNFHLYDPAGFIWERQSATKQEG